MTDVRQSPQFAQFMQDINWGKYELGLNYIYFKKFPLVGNFAKMPRPLSPYELKNLYNHKKTKKIFRFKIAPLVENNDTHYEKIKQEFISSGFHVDKSPFNPTTTIQINLKLTQEILFKNFREAKRRGVRKALKNDLVVRQSVNINNFINIRKNQYSPLGFLFVKEMQMLWKNFFPKNASLLLAYKKNQVDPLAGILLLYFDKIAYYWYASSLIDGKKMFAPTLLVWESLKLAKNLKCRLYDFEGIYDDRFPNASKSWKGFTKFKEGFGGKTVIFMNNFYI